jgi:symplekin
MHRTRIEMFDESNRKRSAPAEPTDGLDQSKRQRVVTEAPIKAHSIPPLPAGDVSWRQLYTLNADSTTANFDVQAFKDPEQLLRIVVPVLQSVDAQKLDHAINVRDTRLLSHYSPRPCGGQREAVAFCPIAKSRATHHQHTSL